MDLSMVGFDDDACFAPSSDPESKHRMNGSDWRGVKMAKMEDYSSVYSNKQMSRSGGNLLDGQMLSFSVNDSRNGGFDLYNSASNGYWTNTGYGSGGVMNGVRGPFTPSQWIELEHQALIYKYILANIPIPSNLLFPIKKALDSAGFSGFSVGPLRPTTLGWGGFHFGFSNNTDPEPGRCRRTDGKKWRCSRDAVQDQKYCERHINRGRHRSRKPVEGQNGHPASGPATTATNAAATSAKLVQATVVPGGGGANGLGMSHQSQLKSLKPSGPNPSDSTLNVNGIFLNKNHVGERNQAATDLSMFSSGINLKSNQFSIDREQKACNEPTRSEFGLVFSNSLLNPIHETSSDSLNGRENSFQSSVHHQFMDEWPKTQLPDNNTQLSISTPISTSDFLSSTSSPTEEKRAPSPLRLSSRQANWVPISWETSIGGPLGEVLHSTNQNSSNECKPSSGLNLVTDGWNHSPGIASSPNGPFQRMAFGSQSNSSAGSSPRGAATSLAPLL